MNRNFILGCLTGIIGGMLGTWMILFVDVKITLRESPVLTINTGHSVSTEEVSIPNPEDGEGDEDIFCVLVNPGLLDALTEEFKDEESVEVELASDKTRKESIRIVIHKIR